MRDADVRATLRDSLAAQHADDGSLVVEELGLCEGEARVDLCVINGALNGYEIKSEADTLSRLPAQQLIYNRSLDYVTIVTGSRHVDAIARCVPAWWGITEAHLVNSFVVLTGVRDATPNPQVDPFALAQLLWRDEALAELERRGLDRGVRTKARRVLWQRLAETVELSELGVAVRSRLKGRETWRVPTLSS